MGGARGCGVEPFRRRSASGLARPGVVRAAAATNLRFVPQIDLAFLDPHWTTANVTRNHGHRVFDTLHGCDIACRASPQMVEGHPAPPEQAVSPPAGRVGEARRQHAGDDAICRDIQVQRMDDVPFFPLGQHAVTTAHRGITGVLKGFPTFRNVRPA